MRAPASVPRLSRLAAVVAIALASGGMDCREGSCQQDSFGPFPAQVLPDEEYQIQAHCSTCGHAVGSATWTIQNSASDPTGTVTLEFYYACAATQQKATRIVTRTVPVGDLAYRTADQGAKDVCGENAEIDWLFLVQNGSPYSLDVRPAIRCPWSSDTGASPTAPGAIRR